MFPLCSLISRKHPFLLRWLTVKKTLFSQISSIRAREDRRMVSVLRHLWMFPFTNTNLRFCNLSLTQNSSEELICGHCASILCCISLVVTLRWTASLFSAPYQFFIRSHLSSKCHLKTRLWLFTCPHGISPTFPQQWIAWGSSLRTYSRNLSHFYKTWCSCFEELRNILPGLHCNDEMQHFTSGHYCVYRVTWMSFCRQLITHLLDESRLLHPPICGLKQLSEPSRWSCPLEISLPCNRLRLLLHSRLSAGFSPGRCW